MSTDKEKQGSEQILTRVHINEEGDVIVSDLWEEIFEELFTEEGGEIVFKY